MPDQHRAEILAELKAPLRPALPLKTPDNRPPLAGLRVVDLGTVLVGPTCGRTLAEFGADVIKIDNPRGQPPDPDVSRGKRSMLIDLTSEAGLDALRRLSDSADVFVQNFRFGIAEKMGFGYEQLRQRNPDLVYMSFNLYGRTGPWVERPGFENQAQAATGMQERFGGASHPAKEALPVNDYGTSLLGAYGIALALYHRNQAGNGSGQHVHTALTFSASMMQSAIFVDRRDTITNEPRGQNALGSAALHRAYQASDGWLFVGALPEQTEKLESVAGLSGATTVPPTRLAMFLEERIRTASVEDWVQRLGPVGVGVHRIVTIPEVMALPYVRARSLYLERPHPDGGTVATIGPIPRLSRTPVQPGRPLRPSLEARDILGEIGLDDRFEQYLADGIITMRQPRRARTG
ncbi:CoA transferase [Caballeronia sp. LZ001]|uniref:CaiB/BaiF CoA transferase family protein n=1 Tax=Caballeronia sp. LZ001 TaxID=3038553 RepID=UPI002866D8B3|nr:CoA transferase [Caballeronia sp. LZ001]MDR5804822.1 CoA transferase [Caballeronia sp. LZ001]